MNTKCNTMTMKTTYNEAAATFKADCREKKSTACSTSRRVGQRKGCKLPEYTSAQLKAMSGPVSEWNLSLPMEWNEFVSLPIDLKKKYLEMLGREFRVSEHELANLFHCSETAVTNYLASLKLSGVLEAAAQGMPFYKSAWICFLRKKKEPCQEKKPLDDDTAQKKELAAAFVAKKRHALGLSHTTFAKLIKCTPNSVQAVEAREASPKLAEKVLEAARKANSKTRWGELMEMSDAEVSELCAKVLTDAHKELGLPYTRIAEGIGIPYTSCCKIGHGGLTRKSWANFLLLIDKWLKKEEKAAPKVGKKPAPAIKVEVSEPTLPPLKTVDEPVSAPVSKTDDNVSTDITISGSAEAVIHALTKLYGAGETIQVTVCTSKN